MDNFDPNIHHRRSIRLKGYDYSRSGLYFITVCVQDRLCLFGEIADGMILNDAGKIAGKCWLEIPEHFPNVILHEYIVMPNHVHGIIELIENESQTVDVLGVDKMVGVENFQPLPFNQPRINEFQKIIPHSIGSIVRGFKIGVTKWFRNNTKIKNVWQRNYYEHIIRNEISYNRIATYIINNPRNWKEDRFNHKG